MKKKCDKTNGQTSSESLQSLVAHIGHIAPNSFNFNQGVQLAATQSLYAINHLKCPLCHCILHRPVELPCRSLVCAECIITCLTLSANNTCPCCYDNSPLTASSINADPEVIQLLEENERLAYFSQIKLLFASWTTFEPISPMRISSPKIHLLEDHTVEWVRRYNFGFGMLGEQGA